MITYMQELVIKNDGNNGLAILHGSILFLGSIALTLSVLMSMSMTIGQAIHYNAGRNYIHTYIIQELMNLQLCMEVGFLPRKISSLTLSVLS